MWTRKELKEQGNFAFKRNYWKCVLVALIISMIAGGVSSYTGAFGPGHYGSKNVVTSDGSEINISGYPDDTKITINGEDVELSASLEDDIAEALEEAGITEDKLNNLAGAAATAAGGAALGAAIAAAVVVFLFVFIIVMAIVLAINAFIINPLVIGGQRFFVKNLDEEANVSNIGYGFDNNYKNIAITMFFRDLYTILWTLLFIIPGIVKSYEYRMIPYLLADDPTMTKDQAFAISKEMMTGNKWKAFVLDLSFLGWHILGILTLGILEIFYVAPYQYSTNAALYRKLLAIRTGAAIEYRSEYDTPYAAEGQVDYTQDSFAQENQNSDEL